MCCAISIISGRSPQWRDLATLNLSRMHSGKYFHTAHERKKGFKKGVVHARARARTEKDRETLALGERRVLGRLTRITSSGAPRTAGAPAVYYRVRSNLGRRKREDGKTIYIGELYRSSSSSSPGNCLAGSQHRQTRPWDS